MTGEARDEKSCAQDDKRSMKKNREAQDDKRRPKQGHRQEGSSFMKKKLADGQALQRLILGPMRRLMAVKSEFGGLTGAALDESV